MEERRKWEIAVKEAAVLLDLLEREMGLSKMKIKGLLEKGCVWRVGQSGKKRKVVRRAKTDVAPGELFEVYYDPVIFALKVPPCSKIEDFGAFSVWYKPAGVLAQGTFWGDHASAIRQVQKDKGLTLLVHRLDRETSGLMLFAHSPKAAAVMQKAWAQGRVEKFYQARVKGILPLTPSGTWEKIQAPLDGKPSVTEYQVVHQSEGTSDVLVRLVTGRFHQIRRHFQHVGHPVMGDPVYGTGNSDPAGMGLVASRLRLQRAPFVEAYGREKRFAFGEACWDWHVPESQRLFAFNGV